MISAKPVIFPKMKNYKIITDRLPLPSELKDLFSQTTWAKDRSIEGVERLLKNTAIFVVIREEEKLIGFGRALTDGIYRALLDDIVVSENYRKQGLGKVIVQNLLDQLESVDQIFLNTKPELKYFYNTFGFSESNAFTMNLSK